jgi:HK97 family phage prohead protease
MSKNNENKNFSNMAVRTYSFEPSSIDLEKRTVDLCVSTGERVLRNNWFDTPVYEQLEISERAIDLKRFKRKAPLLIDHNIYYLGSQVGVVERAWIKNNEFWVTVRFSKRPVADEIFKDVVDGILANVSFGYAVNEYRKYKNEEDKYETVLATSITPYEVSLVTVGADSGAGVRSIDDDYIPLCILEDKEKMFVKLKSNRLLSLEPATTDPVINTEPENKNVQKENKGNNEQERIISIMTLCSKRNIGNDEMLKIIKETRSFEEAKIKIADIIFNKEDEQNKQRIIDNSFNEFEDKNKNTRHAPIVPTGDDEKLLLSRGIENAIQFRVGQKELDDNGKRFYNLSFGEMCRKMVRDGDYLSRSDLIKRVITTSDMPLIMGNTLGRSLLNSYKDQPQTFRKLIRESEKTNLKLTHELQTGSFKELPPVKENEEYTETSFSDSEETYKIAKYGLLFSVTEELILNDELGELFRVPTMFARSAAERESSLVWNQLIDKTILMNDGKPLFHADHKNIGKPAILSNSSLEAALLMMKAQRGLDNEKILINPKFLLVSTALEALAKRLTTQVAATKSEDINIYAGRFEIIVEDRLAALGEKAWILACPPEDIDGLVYAYLKGEKGAKLTREEEFRTDSIKFKCKLFGAAKAVDYRPFYFNAGL